jgi:Xaa-Pro aminopeptidase
MSAFTDRTDRLARRLEELDLDALLVGHLVNVRYLTGFTGTNAAFVITPERRVFITDFRYVERAAHEVPDFERVRGRDDLLGAVTEAVGRGRLGFDDAHMTVQAHAKLAARVGEEVELVPAGGLVEELRAIKDSEEASAIGRATEVADEVYRWLISDHGLAGHTEHAVALALERRAQDLGAEGVSFPPIVAAGGNGALPHATPRRDAVIPPDTLVVVDFGVVLDSYCSDCTRTFATGEIEPEAHEAYELVLSAQRAALAARWTAWRATSSPAPGGGTSSATGSATASASRSTRHPGSRPPRAACWRPATWSRSSPACTCPAGSASGSRTSRSSPPASPA